MSEDKMILTAGEVLDLSLSPAPAYNFDQLWKLGSWAWCGAVTGPNTGTVYDLWATFRGDPDYLICYKNAGDAKAEVVAVNDTITSGIHGVKRQFVLKSPDGTWALTEATQRGGALQAIVTDELRGKLREIAERNARFSSLGI